MSKKSISENSSSDAPVLLTTKEMAHFVSRGFLRFDALVPEALNARFLAEVEESGAPQASPAGTPLADCYTGSVMREILDLPTVAGVVQSLVGPGCLFDHPNSLYG